MKSPVVKRSIVIAGHKTSVSLEDAFWASLKDIAGTRNMTLSELVASIDADRRQGKLSSAIRLYVLDHFRAQSTSRAAAYFAGPRLRNAAVVASACLRPAAARYSAEAEASAPARRQAAVDVAAG